MARDLRVRHGERWALEGLSFDVAAGEVVGLMGPNGASRTTTMSVATLATPTSARPRSPATTWFGTLAPHAALSATRRRTSV